MSHLDKKMVIGLDFDETYTLDPIFWDSFIYSAQRHGHIVYCVTWRHRHEGLEVIEGLDPLIGISNIVFTGRAAKRPFCERLGIYIDVVIDDNPSAWDNNYGGLV